MSLSVLDDVDNEYAKSIFTDKDNLNKLDAWIKAWIRK